MRLLRFETIRLRIDESFEPSILYRMVFEPDGKIVNQHRRLLAASSVSLGPWIEALWSASDRDAFPRDVIANWRSNPDGVGRLKLVPNATVLGHGPFKFRLRHWDGQSWRVELEGAGLHGWHGLDLLPKGEGTQLTHTLSIDGPAPMLLLARLFFEPVHDWAVEATFDRLELALATGTPGERTHRPMSLGVWAALKIARLRHPKRR
jgi:hypothetical protein